MKGVVYLSRGPLFSVRSALVLIRRRSLRPRPSTSVTATRLGCHLRLVCRWLCDTLQPTWARFPVSGQTRDIFFPGYGAWRRDHYAHAGTPA